jgi:uncharacterized protein YecE (DUF72 family)
MANPVVQLAQLRREFPEIGEPTADFTYARFMTTQPRLKQGVNTRELQRLATQCREWAKTGDVFGYFIAAAKARNPAAAQALAALAAPASAPASAPA